MKKLSLICILTLTTFGTILHAETTEFATDDISKYDIYYNYEVGEVVKNNNSYVIDSKNRDIKKTKTIIQHYEEKAQVPSTINNNNSNLKNNYTVIQNKQVQEKTYEKKTQFVMPYVVYGSYNSDNAEKNDYLITSGLYYSMTLPEYPGWTFAIDPEFTYIHKKKMGGKNTRQTDLTIEVANYDTANGIGSSLVFHYTKDNKDTKVLAGQYKLSKSKYMGNGLITYYGKVGYESYRFASEDDTIKTNKIFSFKPGISYTKYNANGLTVTNKLEYRFTHQSKNKKFDGLHTVFMNGIKYDLTFAGKQNILNFSLFYGNETGTIDNDGYIIYNSTDKVKNKIGVKYTRIINPTTNISATYGYTRYEVNTEGQTDNMQTFGIFLGKSF